MMLPKGKRQSCQNVPVDILSNLPEDVINAILMRLFLRDAVRTSILSKKWRYKWCKLSELTLYEGDLGIKNDSIPPTYKFTNMIYHLLTLHAGPITKFSFCIPCLRRCPNIDNLIYYLSTKGVQHLVLKLPWKELYKLPPSIFTCLQMRHLALNDCSIQLPPPAFQGFNWLISLELCRVTISSKFLESLISHCPLLEKLVLICKNMSNVIEINAPMLRSFDFTGNVTCICIKNSPLLEKLFLKDWCSFAVERKCDIAEFFESFSTLELLHLGNGSLKFLDAGRGEVPARLPFALSCVKRLYLDCIYLDELDVVSCVLCLIRSSPNLEYIEIEVADRDDDMNFPPLESLGVEGSSDVTFSHLKEVKLTLYVGSKPEMQLMKLLLARSPMLVRMQIELLLLHDEQKSLYKAIEVPAVLNSFWRASPKAKVVYSVHFGSGTTLSFD